MKKHEKIKYAYDNYPKGTRFKNLGCKDIISESSGEFHLDSHGVRDSVTHCFVFGTENKWAEIVKPSILEGKVAIQVNNEREFNLLMEHYDSKGWRWKSGNKAISDYSPSSKFPYYIYYNHRCYWFSHTDDDEKLVPFSEFASEAGIKVPVKIMTSEDGVDLYEGDKYFQAFRMEENSIWNFNDIYKVRGARLEIDDNVVINPNNNKAFSTRESAEAWIKEQNKKMGHTKLFDKSYRAVATIDHIDIYCNDEFVIRIAPSDLEDMLHAYKSLQQ